MKLEVFVLLQALLWTVVSCTSFNITNLSNCVDVSLDYENDAEIEVRDIIYERNEQGLVDVLHGKFVVHIHREHEDTEVILTIFRCPKGATGTCNENPTDYLEALDCQRFQNDKTGPWYMFAPAVDKTNPCGERMGKYEITGAKIDGQYLEKYMTVEEGHYRVRLLHHLPGKSLETKYLRACIELDFDILP